MKILYWAMFDILLGSLVYILLTIGMFQLFSWPHHQVLGGFLPSDNLHTTCIHRCFGGNWETERKTGGKIHPMYSNCIL